MKQERSTISRDTTSSTTGLRQVMTTKVSNRLRARAVQAPPAKAIMKKLIWGSLAFSRHVISKKLNWKQNGEKLKQKKRKG